METEILLNTQIPIEDGMVQTAILLAHMHLVWIYWFFVFCPFVLYLDLYSRETNFLILCRLSQCFKLLNWLSINRIHDFWFRSWRWHLYCHSGRVRVCTTSSQPPAHDHPHPHEGGLGVIHDQGRRVTTLTFLWWWVKVPPVGIKNHGCS